MSPRHHSVHPRHTKLQQQHETSHALHQTVSFSRTFCRPTLPLKRLMHPGSRILHKGLNSQYSVPGRSPRNVPSRTSPWLASHDAYTCSLWSCVVPDRPRTRQEKKRERKKFGFPRVRSRVPLKAEKVRGQKCIPRTKLRRRNGKQKERKDGGRTVKWFLAELGAVNRAARGPNRGPIGDKSSWKRRKRNIAGVGGDL